MTAGKQFEEFIEIVKKLRKECPWDREQTIETLKPYLVEEVYEALQAIDEKDYDKLAEEVGDMLLHVVMISVFAAETKKFAITDVIESIASKMVRRHPHVFANAKAKDKKAVWLRWEKIKQTEVKGKAKEHRGMLASIPKALPALYRADKIQRRAARVGFDWDQVAGAWDKVNEELNEVYEILKISKQKDVSHAYRQAGRKQKTENSKLREEIGDLLFAITNVARKLEIDAEEALQQANAKFTRRFGTIEKVLQKKKLTIAQMDRLWNKAKQAER